MAKRRPARITLDAFLEAVQDASGFEDDVLLALELKSRELQTWLERHPEARRMARELLAERELDLSGYRLGWLRDPSGVAAPDTDANWALYHALLQEDITLGAQQDLEAAKSRTEELVARLQAEKRSRLERAAKTPPRLESDET